ncbi:shieldin complex subunit 3 [Denticeps clupeoides]|uniref:Uncharacterized protein n=1 Tax=Denticeps clupeoides TaxID=299321 RepID=A0AAY4CQ53_9TELE|nr:shieldin complex subunit 3-like [Denticeps clupeoides]
MDVVLHHRRQDGDLRALLLAAGRAAQDLRPRLLPAFTPWFPTGGDTSLPVRPAKPAPVVGPPSSPEPAAGGSRRSWSVFAPEPAAGGFRRSWSVFAPEAELAGFAPSFSGRFRKAVERHGLHPRQRAKWIVGESNCAPGGLERAWAGLHRAARRTRPPACNANFQRELAQIWVFCDVLHSERVGAFLKRELGLAGQIALAVHRLGNILQY